MTVRLETPGIPMAIEANIALDTAPDIILWGDRYFRRTGTIGLSAAGDAEVAVYRYATVHRIVEDGTA